MKGGFEENCRVSPLLCFVDKASDVRSGSHGVRLVTRVNFFIPSQVFWEEFWHAQRKVIRQTWLVFIPSELQETFQIFLLVFNLAAFQEVSNLIHILTGISSFISWFCTFHSGVIPLFPSQTFHKLDLYLTSVSSFGLYTSCCYRSPPRKALKHCWTQASHGPMSPVRGAAGSGVVACRRGGTLTAWSFDKDRPWSRRALLPGNPPGTGKVCGRRSAALAPYRDVPKGGRACRPPHSLGCPAGGRVRGAERPPGVPRLRTARGRGRGSPWRVDGQLSGRQQRLAVGRGPNPGPARRVSTEGETAQAPGSTGHERRCSGDRKEGGREEGHGPGTASPRLGLDRTGPDRTQPGPGQNASLLLRHWHRRRSGRVQAPRPTAHARSGGGAGWWRCRRAVGAGQWGSRAVLGGETGLGLPADKQPSLARPSPALPSSAPSGRGVVASASRWTS